jgi:hypothetical protein
MPNSLITTIEVKSVNEMRGLSLYLRRNSTAFSKSFFSYAFKA